MNQVAAIKEKAILYCRSAEGNHAKLQSQSEALTEYAKAHI